MSQIWQICFCINIGILGDIYIYIYIYIYILTTGLSLAINLNILTSQRPKLRGYEKLGKLEDSSRKSKKSQESRENSKIWGKKVGQENQRHTRKEEKIPQERKIKSFKSILVLLYGHWQVKKLPSLFIAL